MIKFIKLINGDDIISEIEEHADSITLKNPVQLGINEVGKPIMINYIPLCEDEPTISRQHILFTSNIRLEVQNAYSMKFGQIIAAQPDEVSKTHNKIIY